MKIKQRNLEKHLFICCNQKDSGKCCANKSPEKLIKDLKKQLKSNKMWDKIKVSKSGCLGPCSEGISATLYPNNILITKISVDDTEKLYELLTK